MGILIISAADVQHEYQQLVGLVASFYHPDVPVETEEFKRTLGEVLTEVALGLVPKLRGAVREIWHAAKALIDKVRGIYCVGLPPYKVILWDADTMCLYV